MKGLIIKDVLCLKKQLALYVFVLAGVLAVSVMYVLSARFGNLSLAGEAMLASEELSALDVRNLGTLALVLFMLLPIAAVGDMAMVFEADGRAGFPRVAGALPVSVKKRVLSRFLAIYALFGVGVAIDVLIALLLSLLTDLISFSGLLGIILSSASVMSIYNALVIFFCLLLGYGRESYAQLLSVLTVLAALILVNLKSLLAEFTGTGANAHAIGFLWRMLDFMKGRAWILLLAAALVSVLSFAASAAVAEKKRGVI